MSRNQLKGRDRVNPLNNLDRLAMQL
jgi:hypothetical protein